MISRRIDRSGFPSNTKDFSDVIVPSTYGKLLTKNNILHMAIRVILGFEPGPNRTGRTLATNCINQLIASLRRDLLGPSSNPRTTKKTFAKDTVPIIIFI